MLISFSALAQKKDTVKIKPDFRPTGLRVGTDLISIVRNSSDKTFTGWEVNGDVDFYRYYLVVDYGNWGRSYLSDTSSYTNSGDYFRVGVDVNFLKKDPDRNMFFLGMRYAMSNFSEDLMVVRTSEIWGPLTENFSNNNVNASWFELTTGLRVKIWKVIWMGYTARLKFGLNTGATPDMLPHDVPGYGRADEDSYWGFNYQIFIRIPVRKSPAIPLKK